MADFTLILRPFQLDSPSEVIPESLSFTAESITSHGGSGRIGGGMPLKVNLSTQAIPPQNLARPNSGFVG
jgi:hypothetical protein